MRTAAVILAAGQGTRMKSALPKVLHPLGGRPMIHWSLDHARTVGADPIVMVVGNGADAVRACVGDGVLYATQAEQLGTGHATLQARDLLQGRSDAVLILYGDMPLLRSETLQRLLETYRQSQPAVTILSVVAEDSMGFGRVVRDASGRAKAIVEEAVATPEELAIRELNCGVYCCRADWLWSRLATIPKTEPKGEYYLTDIVGLAVVEGEAVEVVTIDDITEVQGINTRAHLARSEAILRQRIAARLMDEGVTLVDPTTAYVDASVRVGRDTVIYPNTHLQGNTVVGEGCTLGPNSIVRDTRIGNHCTVLASVVEEAILEDGAGIGPFGHLRPGAHLGTGVQMGNFGEVKNAYLAPGTKMGHFSYIGDAEIGEDVNIGAGTITCNFDGVRKHRTVVAKGAFIGSGTMLVAPVTIGQGAKIGAGSVVTRDVEDGTLAYGVPARPKRRLEGREEQDGSE